MAAGLAGTYTGINASDWTTIYQNTAGLGPLPRWIYLRAPDCNLHVRFTGGVNHIGVTYSGGAWGAAMAGAVAIAAEQMVPFNTIGVSKIEVRAPTGESGTCDLIPFSQ